MLGVQLGRILEETPAGITETLDLVTGFDDALTHGLARLDGQRAGALTAMADALHTTPLGPALREAVDKTIAGSAADEHLAALAGGRTALLGAVHDALLAHFDAAAGRSRAPWEAPVSNPETAGGDAEQSAGAAAARDNLLAGCRSWLHELALTGWRGVDESLVSASDQAIAALLAEPGLRRPAVLLDGLATELRASCPVAAMERLPARRWADLWARALMLARCDDGTGGGPSYGAPGAPEPVRLVSGRLLPLGVDVHEHGTAVQVQLHAILEPAGAATAPRLVRTSVAAAKVDTIVGPALWRLLQGHPVLLTALAERRSVEVTEMPLLPGGDLRWHDDQATAGQPAGPFEIARVHLADAKAPAVPPLERHPVRLAEPVLVEGYTVRDGQLDLDGNILAIDLDRLPTCGPLTPELVAASSACVGLLRWDGGRWLLQPVAVQATVKRKAIEAHTGDWALGPTDPKVAKAQAKTGDAVAVLRERAGRLLRR